MTTVTIILLAVIVAVILIDLYLKRKNKLATTKEIEKVIDKEHPDKKGFNKPIVIVTATLLLLIASFFTVNHLLYEGRLTDTDDGVSLLQNITEKQYNISEINLVGDSIYKFNDNTNANGLIYCQYGNIGMLINGNPDGLWTLYHPNGTKKMRVLLINGEQEGIRTDWYNDGSKEFKGNYSKDKQIGFSEFWYKNGQKGLEGIFNEGDFSGDFTKWYENGSVKYIYNHQEKTFKEYWDNGNIYIDAFDVNILAYSPASISLFENASADFYSKKNGELIQVIPHTRTHTRTNKTITNKRQDLSGRPCRSEINCVSYNYYLNGDIFNFSYVDYKNDIITKMYYPDGRLWLDTEQGVKFYRNGILEWKKDEHGVYKDEHGVYNKNRLFERKIEFIYR